MITLSSDSGSIRSCFVFVFCVVVVVVVLFLFSLSSWLMLNGGGGVLEVY